ncbi:MAG: DNA polymerase III subunit beta [Erysipelotrichaceae bacterium]
MYFKISKKNFYSSLSVAARGISSYSPLPAFSGIKIEVNSDSIYLTGSDSDVSIQTFLTSNNDDYTLNISDEGSIVIEAKYILEIVRKIDSDELELEIIDGSLTKISGSNTEFKINGIQANEYPKLDFSKPQTSFRIKSSILKEIIDQTVFASSDKETRPVLTGVNFSASGTTLNCVATDSYRLAKKMVELDSEMEFNITIPSKTLNEVVRILEDSDEVEIAINASKAQFIVNDTIIQTRLIDGVYPDTSKLIPLNFDYSLTIDKLEVLNAIDRASFIKNDGISVVKLSLSESTSTVSTRASEVGSSLETLNGANFKGNDLDISFNGRYVYEAIKVLNGTHIRFSFSGEMKPFIIEVLDNETVLQLVLPVRTYA